MKKLFVKVGTGNLIDSSNTLSREKVSDICRQVSLLMSQGIEVAIVSSGAIKAGRERLESLKKTVVLDKKEFAGVGARHLLNLWGDAFALHGHEVAQVWVTNANLDDRAETTSIRSCIQSYLSSGIVPIINENDVVSDREIQLMDKGISENDTLACHVAGIMYADAVLFLTDIGGVYDANPTTNPKAQRYRVVTKDMLICNSEIQAPSSYGTGGMAAKLRAAFSCSEQGMHVAIASLEEDVILRFASGASVGTLVADIAPH